MLQASEQALKSYSEDVRTLWSPNPSSSIDIYDGAPTAFNFLRDNVTLSRPCILRFPDMLNCNLDDLVDLDPLLRLSVDVTPDGHGDCIRQVDNFDSVFVQPEQRTVSISEFRDQIRSKQKASKISDTAIQHRCFPNQTASNVIPLNHVKNDEVEGVMYYSRQNDCLRTELAPLWERLNLVESFAWAEEAFGTGPPEAINAWIGNERAVSSMHKDHYENLFYVASGEKIFTLCPPADAPFLYEREHTSGKFDSSTGVWSVRMDDQVVHWIAGDITSFGKNDASCNNSFPLLKYAHPVTVHVKAGEMLYLPALWFHRVSQSCETVGFNWWYDMRFDSPNWCYFHLLQQLQLVNDEQQVVTCIQEHPLK